MNSIALVRNSYRKIWPWLVRLFKAYLAYKFYRVWIPRKVKSAEGATVLVTGACGGLGACICREFASRGAARLILWDINAELLEKLANELRGVYPGLKHVSTQIVNLAEHEQIYTAAKTIEGPLHILVNNAGIVTGDSFLDSSDRKNQLTLAVNTLAPMYTTKAFLPDMLKLESGPSPAVINISSMASYCGAAQMVDYTTSKFALRGFSEALQAEMLQLGLSKKCQISCVCPSHMDTKLFKGFYIPGTITMSPEFVARKVVTAYECEQELVILPRHLSPAVVFIALQQALGSYALPNPTPTASPLEHFDRSQADDILAKMTA